MNELTSSEEDPASDRCEPLGASHEDISSPVLQQHAHCELCEYSSEKFEAKLQNLEEEHEMLNSSLCALTTHFAQVQFRLRQAVAAPHEDKEVLLKSLEEFAFRGIPDVGVVRERLDEAKLTEDMWLRRVQQQQLIEKLKSQLRELELTFKSEPVNYKLENQRIAIRELKKQINLELNVEECSQIIPDHVNEADEAFGQLMTPLKMKEELVVQLKIHIADLERFINYLQANNANKTSCTCCAIHSIKKPHNAHKTGIIKRTFVLLHMITVIYLSCSSQQFSKKNVNHWGDLRAKLEMAIAKVLEAIKTTANDQSLSQQGVYSSDNEAASIVCNVLVTTAVRKHLAVSIRDLMQHGAHQEATMYRLATFFGCFRQKFRVSNAPIHAWEIILHYYQLTNGERFNATPTRKLSQSFDLDIAGLASKSNKHTMLSEIGNIISTHSVYKQSYDSQFKAFVCAGLNANRLVAWLSLIFEYPTLLTMHYHSWSYAIKTGFSDSLHSLEALSNFKFDLPADLAIRRFQNVEDLFI